MDNLFVVTLTLEGSVAAQLAERSLPKSEDTASITGISNFNLDRPFTQKCCLTNEKEDRNAHSSTQICI